MPEKRRLPTASIPSRHRHASGRSDVRGSLIVTKLDRLKQDAEVADLWNHVILPNSEALSKMNSSRLRKEIKNRINDQEYDPRSLELLIRLLRSGPLAHDVVNDENREVAEVSREKTDEAFEKLSDTFPVTSQELPPRQQATFDPSVRFRKSIEALKSARERFGVCMSVNDEIAKARTIHKQNLTKRKTGRDQLPALNVTACLESADTPRTPKITPLRPWLTLSGRKIQLKHQGHVDRALSQPGPGGGAILRPRKERNIKSAPIRRPDFKSVPLQRFPWCSGERFVIQKVSKSFRNTKSPISFLEISSSLHGYQSMSPTLELRKSHEISSGFSPDLPESPEKNTKAPEKNTQAPDKNTQAPDRNTQAPDRNTQAPDESALFLTPDSRPTSGTMPHPVRSVIIKLPKSNITTQPLTTMTSSRSVVTSQRNAISFAAKAREEKW